MASDPNRYLPKGAKKATSSCIENWGHPTMGGKEMPGVMPQKEERAVKKNYRKTGKWGKDT